MNERVSGRPVIAGHRLRKYGLLARHQTGGRKNFPPNRKVSFSAMVTSLPGVDFLDGGRTFGAKWPSRYGKTFCVWNGLFICNSIPSSNKYTFNLFRFFAYFHPNVLRTTNLNANELAKFLSCKFDRSGFFLVFKVSWNQRDYASKKRTPNSTIGPHAVGKYPFLNE